MPKKSPIDSYAEKNIVQHLTAVEESLFNLRFRLTHYFAARENIRERFDEVERAFKLYSADCRGEVKRRLKKNT